MPRVTEIAAALLREALKPGDVAVDATAGRGRDTLLMAGLVGPDGHVHAFDLQAEAIASTHALLAGSGLLDRCTLHRRCHSEMAFAMPPHQLGSIGAAVFNLGYLPGSDHGLTTAPGTTTDALRTAMRLLRPGGRLVCVCYTGHPGGEAEADAVFALCDEAKREGWNVSVQGRESGTGRPWVASLTRARI